MSFISDFQATTGASIVGIAGEENFIMHCLSSLLRGLVLLAGVMIGQYCLGLWNGSLSKKAPASPRKVTSAAGRRQAWGSNAGSSLKPRIGGKRPVKAMSDDEDAMSTSAGSSDGASDVCSSDEEELGSMQPGRISKSDLLKCRPATGTAISDGFCGLKAKHVDHRTKLAPLSDKRSWDSLRAAGTPSTQKSTALPVKASPALKPSRKGAPAPKLQADETTLTPARVEALLQICCADPPQPVTLSMALGEGKSPTQNVSSETTQSSQVVQASLAPQATHAPLPPWRKRSA